MSIYDTLTGINGYTFILLLVLFLLMFPKELCCKIARKIIGVVAFLGMIYFLLTGWRTLNYDSVVPYKGRHITFPDGEFEQICNLKKLYYANGYEYRIATREASLSFDCMINNVNDDFASRLRDDKKFVQMGDIKGISSKQVFTVVDSYKTKSVGFAASFGGSGVQFVVLESNGLTYNIYISDFEKGEIR